jgi:hypothetical protein
MPARRPEALILHDGAVGASLEAAVDMAAERDAVRRGAMQRGPSGAVRRTCWCAARSSSWALCALRCDAAAPSPGRTSPPTKSTSTSGRSSTNKRRARALTIAVRRSLAPRASGPRGFHLEGAYWTPEQVRRLHRARAHYRAGDGFQQPRVGEMSRKRRGCRNRDSALQQPARSVEQRRQRRRRWWRLGESEAGRLVGQRPAPLDRRRGPVGTAALGIGAEWNRVRHRQGRSSAARRADGGCRWL